MKKILILIIAGLFYSGCIVSKVQKQVSKDILIVHYHFTSEFIYEDIKLENNKLKYTHVKNDFKCPNYYIAQAPCYSSNDLTTDEFTLNDKDLNELVKFISKSGFLELNGFYGGATQSQRYYHYYFAVKLNDKESNVTYQSFPDADPMPEAFKILQDKILSLVN